MVNHLVVQEITDKTDHVIGLLDGISMELGRETENGIKVAREGVSRDHGRFLKAKQSWLYADLGSTNGSWLNGVRLQANSYQVVRAGDMIQIADAMLRLKRQESQPNSRESASLVVLQSNNIVDEFPIPEIGQALLIGGMHGDLPLDSYTSDIPCCSFDRTREGLKLNLNDKDLSISVIHNGARITNSVLLGHNDQILVGDYYVVVSLPPRLAVTNENDDLQLAAQRMRNLAFGKDLAPMSKDELEATTSISNEEEVPPQSPEQVAKFAMIEDGVILILGIILLGGLLGIGAWWFIHN